MIFIDSNVFLDAILDTSPAGERARRFLSTVGAGAGASSPLVLDEVFWSVRQKLGRAEALERCRRIRRHPSIRLLPVDAPAWDRAAQLLAEHKKLGPRDALHAAVALEHGISTIASTDPDFDVIPAIRRRPPA